MRRLDEVLVNEWLRMSPSSYRPDPNIEAQFGRWPLQCSFERAQVLGLQRDASLDDLIRTRLEPA
jgi:hypothetical protein